MSWFLSRENTPCSQRSWNRLQPSPMNSALHKPLQYQVSPKNVLHTKRDPFNQCLLQWESEYYRKYTSRNWNTLTPVLWETHQAMWSRHTEESVLNVLKHKIICRSTSTLYDLQIHTNVLVLWRITAVSNNECLPDSSNTVQTIFLHILRKWKSLVMLQCTELQIYFVCPCIIIEGPAAY